MGRELLGAGQIFAGRYRIERFLAEGGFGAVYVAEQLATEARVAVKVLWPHVLQAKDAAEKFEQEARIAGRVNSDHIVRVVDAGFDETTQMPFLVMELLTGEDLANMVERQGPLAPDLAIEYMRQTASALDRAHGYKDKDGVVRPIVHRDLKPENLFVARRDNGETTIKVLDFGIAKVLGATSNVSREVKGTPLFMAYEQAGVGAITPQTDVWALGLIAFHLLTGTSYWRAAHMPEASLTQLFGEVLSLPLDPPSQRAAELGLSTQLPPAFDRWFFGCVNRDPQQRFATAGAAIAALAELCGIAPVRSRSTPPTTERSGPEPPVSRALTADVGHAPTLLSGAATETALAVSGRLDATPERKRSTLPAIAVAALVLAVGGVATGVLLNRGARATDTANASATGEAAAVVPTLSAGPSVAPVAASDAGAEPPPSASASPAGAPPAARPVSKPTAAGVAAQGSAPKIAAPPKTKEPSAYGER